MKAYRALLGTLAATALAIAPACRNTAQGVKEDARQNAEKAQQEAKEIARKISAEAKETGTKIGEAAKEAGGKVAEGAKDVGEKVKAGAKEVASEVGAAKQTADVKAHLVAAKNIDSSHIEVDTDAGAKTVTLRGTVPTAGQKAAAEKVARENAEGYRVHNLLTVAKK
jgi:osmotically-inducible protein OsmY